MRNPSEENYYFPAECHPHEATWLSFPVNIDTWEDRLDRIYPAYFKFIETIALSEKVRINANDSKTIEMINQILEKFEINKTNIELFDHKTNDSWCRDHGPGFLVNRLLLPYMGEAAFLLQEGMNIEFVDKVYVKEFGMPMGPFELMDEVGLDVCLKVLKIFKKAFGERIELAPCMEALGNSGRLGRKNGKGFYTYTEDGKRGAVDQTVYAALGLGQPSNPYDSKECIERGVFAMVNECSLALIEDRIVETPHEVDLAMIMGTGFPPFRGGLMKYTDSVGTQYVADQLAMYASSRKAARLKPATPLTNMAKSNSKFYK